MRNCPWLTKTCHERNLHEPLLRVRNAETTHRRDESFDDLVLVHPGAACVSEERTHMHGVLRKSKRSASQGLTIEDAWCDLAVVRI